MSKNKNEIAQANTGVVPAFMREDKTYKPEMGAEDKTLPSVKILQAVSPEVTDSKEGAKAGVLWHNIQDESLGAEITIIPLRRLKRYVLFNPNRGADEGILARSGDGIHWSPPNTAFQVDINGKKVTWETKGSVAESGLVEWGTSDPSDPNSIPAATRIYTAICIAPDKPELGAFMLNLQRSSEKVAKSWNSKIDMANCAPYGQLFNLSIEKVKRGSGEVYFVPNFKAAGFVQDVDRYMEYKQMHESLLGKQIVSEDKPETNTSEENSNF